MRPKFDIVGFVRKAQKQGVQRTLLEAVTDLLLVTDQALRHNKEKTHHG